MMKSLSLSIGRNTCIHDEDGMLRMVVSHTDPTIFFAVSSSCCGSEGLSVMRLL